MLTHPSCEGVGWHRTWGIPSTLCLHSGTHIDPCFTWRHRSAWDPAQIPAYRHMAPEIPQVLYYPEPPCQEPETCVQRGGIGWYGSWSRGAGHQGFPGSCVTPCLHAILCQNLCQPMGYGSAQDPSPNKEVQGSEEHCPVSCVRSLSYMTRLTTAWSAFFGDFCFYLKRGIPVDYFLSSNSYLSNCVCQWVSRTTWGGFVLQLQPVFISELPEQFMNSIENVYSCRTALHWEFSEDVFVTCCRIYRLTEFCWPIVLPNPDFDIGAET